MASLVWFEEGSTAYWKARILLEGGMWAKACAGSMVATVSLKPPHPRAPYEVGSWQMLASTTLVWSSGVSVIGRKASKASFPGGRMDRTFVGFLGPTEKTLQPTLDQMLSFVLKSFPHLIHLL